MDKELELEAEKLYPVNHIGSMFMANREQINNFYKQKGFIAGATSKYVEKQKLKFAIEQIKSISLGLSDGNTVTVYNLSQKIKELEQKLSEL